MLFQVSRNASTFHPTTNSLSKILGCPSSSEIHPLIQQRLNRSFVQNSGGEFTGLEVLSGNNLAFVGGNIKLDRGNLTARGGNIELGGLTEAGIVSINPDGSLSFPDDVTKADINLSNGASGATM
jgi:hypothetical protein